MKKLIIFLSIFLGAHWTMGQCTPDTNTANYKGNFFYPDTFPCATQGQFFDQTIYIRIPRQVTADKINPNLPSFLVITIDSVRVYDITGLPAALSYTMNPTSKTIYGGSFGCVRIKGMVTAAPGEYFLDFSGKACGKAAAIDSCIENNLSAFVSYSIKVCAAPTGIISPTTANALVLMAQPNPVSDVLKLHTNVPAGSNYSLRLYNVLGTLVRELPATEDNLTIDMRTLATGVYTAELIGEGMREVVRVVKE